MVVFMLKISNLKKSFGSFQALNGLNLEIAKGELFGFVGPNGAGKTTTMKIISGLLSADSGEVYIDGINALKDSQKLKQKIGYMPDFFGAYNNLKAYEYMEFYASVYGIIGRDARELCNNLLDLVNLTDKADAYVDGLSRGMKQRLCLARSLVHNPELLILDEPASGLDPRARFEMKEILKNLSDMEKTIIISSHILPELAEMCSTIGIIEHGEMVANGTLEDIQNTLQTTRSVIICVTNADAAAKAVQLLHENPLIHTLSRSDLTISAILKDSKMEASEITEAEASILTNLVSAGVSVYSFHREEGNLESLFMQITEEHEDPVI